MSTLFSSDDCETSRKVSTSPVMEVFATGHSASLFPGNCLLGDLNQSVSRLDHSKSHSVVLAKGPSSQNINGSQRGSGGPSVPYGLHLQQIEHRLLNRPNPLVLNVLSLEEQGPLITQKTSSDKKGNDFLGRLASITNSNAEEDDNEPILPPELDDGFEQLLNFDLPEAIHPWNFTSVGAQFERSETIDFVRTDHGDFPAADNNEESDHELREFCKRFMRQERVSLYTFFSADMDTIRRSVNLEETDNVVGDIGGAVLEQENIINPDTESSTETGIEELERPTLSTSFPTVDHLMQLIRSRKSPGEVTLFAIDRTALDPKEHRDSAHSSPTEQKHIPFGSVPYAEVDNGFNITESSDSYNYTASSSNVAMSSLPKEFHQSLEFLQIEENQKDEGLELLKSTAQLSNSSSCSLMSLDSLELVKSLEVAVQNTVPTEEDQGNPFEPRTLPFNVPISNEMRMSIERSDELIRSTNDSTAPKPKPRLTKQEHSSGCLSFPEDDTKHIFDSIGSPQDALEESTVSWVFPSNTATGGLSHRFESSSNKVGKKEHGHSFEKSKCAVQMSQGNSSSLTSSDLEFADSSDEVSVAKPVLRQSIPKTADMIDFRKSISIDSYPSHEQIEERPIPALSLMKQAVDPSDLPEVLADSLSRADISEPNTQLQSSGLPILLSNRTDVSSDASRSVAYCSEELGEMARDLSSAETGHHSDYITPKPL